MNLIDVSCLTKSFGSAPLLDGLTFTVAEGERVGVIGRNGCGKSTLFKILAGQLEPDGGSIARKRGLTVGYLQQKPQFASEATIRSVLESHLGEAREMLARYAKIGEELGHATAQTQAKLLSEQEVVHEWLDHHASWNLAPRIEELCQRFSIPDLSATIGSLSGGWNQRVALAGILLGQPDLLILDEPTNQLDADTVAWLEAHLSTYPGAVLMVTHDRYFLDRVVSGMFELADGKLTTFTGGYSAYLEEKAERLEREEASQARLANLLRREEAWLARGAKARTTKQKARIDRVEDLRGQKSGPGARDLSLTFTPTRKLGSTVIEARGLTVGYPGKVLVSKLDFTLRAGERVGILGPNGCGKTTLIRALLGEIPPASGTVAIGKHTRVAYLDQGRTGLDESLSVAEAINEDDWVRVGGPYGEKRHKTGYLESFLFSRVEQRKPVSTLSGGERARLLLAKMLLTGANVLVLDEPTNDLDIPTLQVLDEALTDFEGSVLMVTHDRYFLDRVATGILHFSETPGRVVFYEGNYEVFTRLRPTVSAPVVDPPPPRKVVEKIAAKGLTSAEKKRLAAVEARIGALETRMGEIANELHSPETGSDHVRLAALSEENSRHEAELETLMEEWGALESKK